MKPTNLFEAIPRDLPEERIEALLQRPGLRIERILSRGHASPPGFWYEQPQGEWVLLLRGEAGLRFEGEGGEVRLKAGDCLDIPAGCRHRVAWTSREPEAVWLAVFYGQAPDPEP